jgi:hypothetical protein
MPATASDAGANNDMRYRVFVLPSSAEKGEGEEVGSGVGKICSSAGGAGGHVLGGVDHGSAGQRDGVLL